MTRFLRNIREAYKQLCLRRPCQPGTSCIHRWCQNRSLLCTSLQYPWIRCFLAWDRGGRHRLSGSIELRWWFRLESCVRLFPAAFPFSGRTPSVHHLWPTPWSWSTIFPLGRRDTTPRCSCVAVFWCCLPPYRSSWPHQRCALNILKTTD